MFNSKFNPDVVYSFENENKSRINIFWAKDKSQWNLNKFKKNLIDKTLVTDSLEIARNKYPGLSNSLDALCKRFNIDLSSRIKHNALLDCELLREVYINLLEAKEPKLNLSPNNFEQNIIVNKSYNKDIVNVSDLELKLHKEFLKKELKKNFY